MSNVNLPKELTIGHSEFTPMSNFNFNKIASAKEILKERFIDEYESKNGNVSHIIVAVLLPSGATELIINTSNLYEKYRYYIDSYDSYFHLKANTMVQIVNFMIV